MRGEAESETLLVTFQFYFETERRLNSLEDKHNHCLPSRQTDTEDNTPLGFVSDKTLLLSQVVQQWSSADLAWLDVDVVWSVDYSGLLWTTGVTSELCPLVSPLTAPRPPPSLPHTGTTTGHHQHNTVGTGWDSGQTRHTEISHLIITNNK